MALKWPNDEHDVHQLETRAAKGRWLLSKARLPELANRTMLEKKRLRLREENSIERVTIFLLRVTCDV